MTLSQNQFRVGRAFPRASSDIAAYQTISEITINDVRKQFADEDAKEANKGTDDVHPVTTRSFISSGLDIEERQWVFTFIRMPSVTDITTSRRRFRLCGSFENDNTNLLSANTQNARTSLRRQIAQWRKAQNFYMPTIASRRDDTVAARNVNEGRVAAGAKGKKKSSTITADENGNIHPEHLNLFLPSDAPDAASEELRLLEVRLRRAQTDDSLSIIRKQLRVRAALNVFKQGNVNGTGNKPNTRIQTLYGKVREKINLASHRYRHARQTLIELQPEANWDTILRELHDDDITGPGRDDEDVVLRRRKKQKEGNGFFTQSWIWVAPGANAPNEDGEIEFHNSVRVEWAKTYARVSRWEEEVKLLCEEMRRVISFCVWKSNWWLEQRERREGLSPQLKSGINAYASKQSAVFARLSSKFFRQWYYQLRLLDNVPKWLSEFSHLLDDEEQSGEAVTSVSASSHTPAPATLEGEVVDGVEEAGAYEEADGYDTRQADVDRDSEWLQAADEPPVY